MNKADLEKRILELKNTINRSHTNIDFYEHEVFRLNSQLDELNNPKTGRVHLCDVVIFGTNLFYINKKGLVRQFVHTFGNCLRITGREFYDRASAELFALREKTEYKIWCEFGDEFGSGVFILYIEVYPSFRHKNVRYLLGFADDDRTRVDNFLDTLSPEELNSIRSE